MAITDTFTTGDNTKVIGLPLLKKDGTQPNFAGASATLHLKDPFGISISRNLMWNSLTPWTIGNINGIGQWEYALALADLPHGHTGIWRGMAFVTFSGGQGPIASSEFTFLVVDPD